MSRELEALAARVEAAPAMRPDRTLNREVALAVGWARKTPSESRKSYPTWYHPDDVRNGHVVLDSLHGTDVWREPLDYLGSLDAAVTLVGDNHWRVEDHPLAGPCAVVGEQEGYAATPVLALVAAALRCRLRASLAREPGEGRHG